MSQIMQLCAHSKDTFLLKLIASSPLSIFNMQPYFDASYSRRQSTNDYQCAWSSWPDHRKSTNTRNSLHWNLDSYHDLDIHSVKHGLVVRHIPDSHQAGSNASAIRLRRATAQVWPCRDDGPRTHREPDENIWTRQGNHTTHSVSGRKSWRICLFRVRQIMLMFQGLSLALARAFPTCLYRLTMPI